MFIEEFELNKLYVDVVYYKIEYQICIDDKMMKKQTENKNSYLTCS